MENLQLLQDDRRAPDEYSQLLNGILPQIAEVLRPIQQSIGDQTSADLRQIICKPIPSTDRFFAKIPTLAWRVATTAFSFCQKFPVRFVEKHPFVDIFCNFLGENGLGLCKVVCAESKLGIAEILSGSLVLCYGNLAFEQVIIPLSKVIVSKSNLDEEEEDFEEEIDEKPAKSWKDNPLMFTTDRPEAQVWPNSLCEIMCRFFSEINQMYTKLKTWRCFLQLQPQLLLDHAAIIDEGNYMLATVQKEGKCFTLMQMLNELQLSLPPSPLTFTRFELNNTKKNK
jgi:hypothetical protein